HFQGFEVFVWMDADTWVQDGEAVDQLAAFAEDGKLAIVPEVDRSYYKFDEAPQAWEVEHRVMRACIGDEITNTLRYFPTLNAGVFALRHDAPHWNHWIKYLRIGLQHIRDVNDRTRCVEQVALNAAVRIEKLSAHYFPTSYNWLACMSVPA